MKKIVFILFLYTVISFSQNKKDFDYEKFSNPTEDNELSMYFKKEIPKKVLKKIDFNNDRQNIVLSFSINKEKKPYRIQLSSFNGDDFEKAIIEAFKKYPLEKLNLHNFDSKNRYYLQIASRKRNKAFINCSSKIIVETPPICEPCEDLNYFEDLKSCLNIEVKKHLYQNINFELLNSINSKNQINLKDEKDLELYFDKEVDLFIQFTVDENGKLINKKTKVPSFLKDEIEKALNSFPKIKNPSTFFGQTHNPLHSFTIYYKEGEETVYKDSRQEFSNFTKPNPENQLSLFFKEKLSEDLLEKSNLNRFHNRLTISFELDKKNKPFNIKTNARSTALNEKIITEFKEYPIVNLNFADKSDFNNYLIQILSFEDSKNTINTSSIVGYERIPIYVGCENSKDIQDAKRCFSKNIQMHYAKKFDADLPNRLGLSAGKLSILINFKIDKEGNITKITTKLSKPSPQIEAETKRVMSLIPNMKSSAMQNGKIVNISYRIPFTLYVN
ncbi:hypothetical protein [Polaribacter sp. Hel_I_88]|uniref:hypothetical protein n=1 Tax=Polaribacter sp. Hel_I_88 TaxID=1250006 RepID=UPI00068A97B5|nr:hypothetical protein [Polaribacter sp. Hel_I_88]